MSASARAGAPRDEAQDSGQGSSIVSGVGFLLLGMILGVGIILARDAVNGLEGGVTEVASLLPFGYAFAAGMVATVNPCGVLLLPSLVAYYLGKTGATDRPRS